MPSSWIVLLIPVAMLLFLLHALAATRNQRIGLHLAVAVEYAQITQITMPGGEVSGEGQLQAIPGPLAGELQGSGGNRASFKSAICADMSGSPPMLRWVERNSHRPGRMLSTAWAESGRLARARASTAARRRGMMGMRGILWVSGGARCPAVRDGHSNCGDYLRRKQQATSDRALRW